MFDFSFYKDKKVFITGHTGFKGAWMCRMLLMAGADVTGYALEPPTRPSLFELCGLLGQMHSIIGDIRDLANLKKAFYEAQPEVVIHMAAQPLVRESYHEPVYTYETNVMGTVHILECIRTTSSVRSFVSVTTDKVYFNREWTWGYRENEELNGYDPYSNSKSCSELVTSCYRNSFFAGREIAITTARAGNVIGGGDFAKDRIIPDCVRAAIAGEDIIVRNPASTRPYQHVLEPLYAYLMIAGAQYEDVSLAGSYNIGPDATGCRTTGELVGLFCKVWKEKTGRKMGWKTADKTGPHEANFLKLDNSRLKAVFGWKPRWDLEMAMEKIVEWSWIYINNGDVSLCMEKQIGEFLGK